MLSNVLGNQGHSSEQNEPSSCLMEPPFSRWWQIDTLYRVPNQVKKTLKKKISRWRERRGCSCWQLNEAGRESSANTLEKDSWGVQRPWGHSLPVLRNEEARWAEVGTGAQEDPGGGGEDSAGVRQLTTGWFYSVWAGKTLGAWGAGAWSDSALKDSSHCWAGNGQEGAKRWRMHSLDGRWRWCGLGCDHSADGEAWAPERLRKALQA